VNTRRATSVDETAGVLTDVNETLREFSFSKLTCNHPGLGVPRFLHRNPGLNNRDGSADVRGEGYPRGKLEKGGADKAGPSILDRLNSPKTQ
jgi:hypothetical protein